MTDDRMYDFVGFELAGEAYAIPLEHVERAIRAVAVSEIPETPDWFAGVFNWAGQTTPVFDLRPVLRLPASPLSVDDRLLFVRRSGRTCALVAETNIRVISVPSEAVVSVEEYELEPRPIRSVVRWADRIYLELDLGRLFESVAGILSESDGRAEA